MDVDTEFEAQLAEQEEQMKKVLEDDVRQLHFDLAHRQAISEKELSKKAEEQKEVLAKERDKEEQRLVADEILIKKAKEKIVDAKEFLETLQKMESEHKAGLQKIEADFEAEVVTLKNETKTKIVEIKQATEQKSEMLQKKKADKINELSDLQEKELKKVDDKAKESKDAINFMSQKVIQATKQQIKEIKREVPKCDKELFELY